MPKLAIVIPYFKIDFFEETIKSVANQNNTNFTLYIGNDASPHDPLPLIEKYLGDLSYFYFEYNDNLGGLNLALQWERILENVKEEWFQILGDDDVISENFVEEFYRSLPLLESENITVTKFTHDWIDENNTEIRSNDYKTDFINSINFVIQKYQGLVYSSLSENIFKTEKYRRHKFEKIPLAWGTDEIALLRFSDYGRIYYNRKSKVFVRISSSSISGSEQMETQRAKAYNCFREKLILNHSKYFPKDFINHILKEYLNYCHINKQSANYNIAKVILMRIGFKAFLKTLRKIYYINILSRNDEN